MPQKHAAQYDETGLTWILVECRMDRNELLFKPIHHRQPHRLLCREVAQDGGLCDADRVRDELEADRFGALRRDQLEDGLNNLPLTRAGWQSIVRIQRHIPELWVGP